jgi:ubiquinone/menaquinone biosynthesis C-methylase UbiE
VVLDLRCGSGHIAEQIAPYSHWMHCADTDTEAIAQCRGRFSGKPNAEFHVIPYADLSALKGKGVSKAYTERLFTRSNFYDLTFYLREVHAVLNAGGLLCLAFHDGDIFQSGDPSDSFHAENEAYRETRIARIFDCAQMSSLATMRNIMPQIGFDIQAMVRGHASLTRLVARRGL